MTTVFTLTEVEKHKRRGDCWLIIHDKVYDVSRYAEEHPGGDQVLFAATGKDATFEFDDRGHSDDAWELMSQFVIGAIDVTTLPVQPGPWKDPRFPSRSLSEMFITLLPFLIPLSILAVALCVKFLSHGPRS